VAAFAALVFAAIAPADAVSAGPGPPALIPIASALLAAAASSISLRRHFMISPCVAFSLPLRHRGPHSEPRGAAAVATMPARSETALTRR
jgi:hypothetical protein